MHGQVDHLGILMRRIWLDNALVLEIQRMELLIQQIVESELQVREVLLTLRDMDGYSSVQGEWRNTQLVVQTLINSLQVVQRQLEREGGK